jgi:hypothetical protein
MKIRFASLFVLILLVSSFATAQTQTPGAIADAAYTKLITLWHGFDELDKGPNGTQWDVEMKTYMEKRQALNARYASYDPRVAAFNAQNDSLGNAINQWKAQCSKEANPNGLPEPQYTQCITWHGNLNGQGAALDPQRNSLRAEKAQLDSEDSVLVAENTALTARAGQYNSAKRQLITDYNAQLVITQKALMDFVTCQTATPTVCGTVSDVTQSHTKDALAYAPLKQLSKYSYQAMAGTWNGTWSGDGGFAYTFVMTLDWGTGGTVQGRIVWTLTGVPAGDEFTAYRSKIGHSATEYVRGNYHRLSGYDKTDAENIIGLDSYNVSIPDDNPDVITGTTYTNKKDWSGQFHATRVGHYDGEAPN